MEKKYLTNEVKFSFNYENIDKDFLVFHFKQSDPDGDSFFDFNKNLQPIDRAKHDLPGVLSVAFFHGREFFALFDKNGLDYLALHEAIKKLLAELDPAGLIEFKMPSLRQIDDRKLLQLLLNALPALARKVDGERQLNNVAGRLFHVLEPILSKTSRDKAIGAVKQFPTLDLSVKYFDGQKHRLCLALDVQTFTNIKWKQWTSASGKENSKCPIFAFDAETRTMRRTNWQEKGEMLFIKTQFPGERSPVPLLDFEDLAAFRTSKCGVLHEVLEQVEAYLAKYFDKPLRLCPPDFENYEHQKFDAKTSGFAKAQRRKFYQQRGLLLVDEVRDANSEKLATELLAALRELPILEGCNVEPSDVLLPGSPCLRIVHERAHYLKENLPDPHDTLPADCLAHHLTAKKFNEMKRKSWASALKNILKELCLKNDVLQNRITVYDWQHGRWQFFSREPSGEGDEKKEVFGLLTIETDGSMQFDRFDDGANKLQTHFFGNENREVEALVIGPAGDVNKIHHTGLLVLPEFRHIGETLKKVEQPADFERVKVEQTVQEFLEKPENLKFQKDEKVQRFREKLNRLPGVVSKKDLRDLLIGRNEGEKGNKIGDGFKKSFIQFFEEKTGYLLKDFLKDEQHRSLFAVECNFHRTSERMAIFYVGKKGSLPSQFATASNVRRVVPALGDQFVFDQLLPTLNVDFVKHEELTVRPFPFKYLREYLRRATNDGENQ